MLSLYPSHATKQWQTTSNHTWYLSRIPRIYPCKFFLAGVNFYRFNAKNWHFRQILREKMAFFFTDLTQKIGVFGVNFILQKFCPCKKMTNIRYENEWQNALFLGSCIRPWPPKVWLQNCPTGKSRWLHLFDAQWRRPPLWKPSEEEKHEGLRLPGPTP